MIRWDLLKSACEDRIMFYRDALESGKKFGALSIERKYLRLIARYQRLLFFIDQRTAIVKPKTAQI